MRILAFTLIALGALIVQVIANPMPAYELGLYGDAAGTVRDIHAGEYGDVTIYVVLYNHFSDAVADIQFSAPPPACFNAVYVGDSSDFTWAGDSRSLVWVWGPFDHGSHHILTTTYSGQGITPECCWFEPQSDRLELGLNGVWINPNEAHNCVAPVEQSTWGAIKAMYR